MSQKQQSLDPELLKILACPVCQGGVIEDQGKVICQECGRKYPIRNGIPVMLAEEGE